MRPTTATGCTKVNPGEASTLDEWRAQPSLPHLRDGCKVSLVEVQAQHAAIAKDVREVARITDAEPEGSAHQKLDPFKSRMGEFAKAAQARVDSLETGFGPTPRGHRSDPTLLSPKQSEKRRRQDIRLCRAFSLSRMSGAPRGSHVFSLAP